MNYERLLTIFLLLAMFLEWDEIQNEELKEFAMKYADKFTQIPD